MGGENINLCSRSVLVPIIHLLRFLLVSSSYASRLFLAPQYALEKPVEKAVHLVSQLVPCVDLSLSPYLSHSFFVYSEKWDLSFLGFGRSGS